MSLLLNSLVCENKGKDIVLTEKEFTDLLTGNSVNTEKGDSLKIVGTSEEPKKKLYRVERDVSYDNIEWDLISKHCLHMDSDVFEYTSKNPTVMLKQVFNNKKHYKLNNNFTVKELNDYLLLWGKIPTFLELKESEGKGWGIFTKNDIMPNMFLGFYQGNVRPNFPNKTNKYLFECVDFEHKGIGQIDAENITFCNFARWINDGKEHNVDYVEHNYQVYAYTTRYIKAGEELIAPYGESYWAMYGGKKD